MSRTGEKRGRDTRLEGGQIIQFGVCIATKIDDWQLIQYAEELGYDRAWVPDSR